MKQGASLDFDVIIAGAGVIGNSLACALSLQGLRVGQIDPEPKTNPQLTADIDLRVFSITRTSEFLLKNLAVWQHLPSHRLGRFDKMQVWADQGEINFDVSHLGEPALGHIIEQSVLQYGLKQQQRYQKNWQVLSGRQLENFYQEPKCMRVKLDNGQFLETALLVAADGKASVIRQLANINLESHDYYQQALVTTLKTEKPHHFCARQRFLKQGPLAFLPLHDPHTVSIVWTLPTDLATQQLNLSNTEFEKQVAHAFQQRLGAVSCLDKRVCFPLKRQQAQTYIQNRLVLIGDAAHSIHPLAGQGVNLGLLDVAYLSDVLQQGQIQARDLGAKALLRRYERQRKSDNLAMAYTMDGFNHLFSNNQPLLTHLRNWGLNLTNRIPTFKQSIMRYAMGQRDHLPPLMQRSNNSYVNRTHYHHP